MKRLHFVLLFLSIPVLASAQKISLKTNLLYDATATVNLGAEIALGERWTLELPFNYNAWEFGDARWKHFLAQPEVRYWTCRKFNGHFFGLHGHYAKYNVGGMKFLSDNMEHNRYDGDLYGGGISWGYQWILGDRWSIETTIGAGYAHLEHDKYPIAECGDVIKSDKKDYWGITKLGVTLSFFIR